MFDDLGRACTRKRPLQRSVIRYESVGRPRSAAPKPGSDRAETDRFWAATARSHGSVT